MVHGVAPPASRLARSAEMSLVFAFSGVLRRVASRRVACFPVFSNVA